MRYVKISDEPGVRRDLLTGEDIYSSRFLNAEEHMMAGRVEEAWCTLWGYLIATPRYLRKEWSIRWSQLNYMETLVIVFGLCMAILVGLLIGRGVLIP